MRNLVAVNSRPHTVADCLNYANPEKPERLGELIRACDALKEAANAFSTPFVSGNVSLYNECALGPAAPTPTILGVGIVKDVRKAVTTDLKHEGNILYIVGETKNELAGSEYYNVMGYTDGFVPKADVKKTKEDMERLLYAMDHSLVRSCHDLSEGGLLAAAAEMAFGGDLGMAMDLSALGELRTDKKLFSESNGRWLVEVESKDREKFEKAIPEAQKIARVLKDKVIKIRDGPTEISLPLPELREKWETAVEAEKSATP
jgi:phosphoribosylformylglycinamidine synthase